MSLKRVIVTYFLDDLKLLLKRGDLIFVCLRKRFSKKNLSKNGRQTTVYKSLITTRGDENRLMARRHEIQHPCMGMYLHLIPSQIKRYVIDDFTQLSQRIEEAKGCMLLQTAL